MGKLYRKLVFSKVNGQPGYREDWILNTFFSSSNTAAFVLYNLV